MTRARTIPNEMILAAARDLFLAHGFGAATTEIARAAGVSEALLFKRFGTKERLFVAAMELDAAPAWIGELDQRVGVGGARSNLIKISLDIVEGIHAAMPRLMMMWSARRHLGAEREIRNRKVERDTQALARYLEQEMRLGRVRQANADTLALVIFGALVNRVLVGMVHGQARDPAADALFVKELVDTLWRGLSPARDETPRRGRRSNGPRSR